MIPSMVGESLKRTRCARKLSREKVEELSGIHRNTLLRYETDGGSIRISRLFELAAVYGKSPDQIIREALEMTKV